MTVSVTVVQHVYGVWDESDYYGPHLQSLHASEVSAQAEVKRLNGDGPQTDRTGPYIVQEHEVQP